MEDRKPIIIQGHIDMVCEKNADVDFDFDNDPIQCYIDGDWVKAKGTTLGADNGVGVAMGMAILDSKDIPHPAIELLCTLDEETGLTGAIQLGTDLLKGKILINLDSEEDGTFTIGCAGGINSSAKMKYDATTPVANTIGYQLVVKGLRGGHSGIEIHDGRANAARLLNRVLYELSKKFDYQLSSFNSGSKHNAIPREAFAVIAIPKNAEQNFKEEIKLFGQILKSEFLTKEPNISFNATSCELPKKVMTKQMQTNVIKSFYAMPHGVVRMSPDMPGLVQTSTNFAVVKLAKMKFLF
jgi:dipeptidase D